MSKSKSDGDYQGTLLYRNAKAVQQQLDAQTIELDLVKQENVRLRNELTVLAQQSAETRHLVDTMWVKWMGHGSTE